MAEMKYIVLFFFVLIIYRARFPPTPDLRLRYRVCVADYYI